MRKLSWSVGGILAGLILIVGILRVVGLNPGAFERLTGTSYVITPGLWLTGEVVKTPITDWSFAETIVGLTAVQTREWFLPALAHSVIVARQVYKGQLYLASVYPAGIPLPAGRHWNRNVSEDPHVRIRIGDKLYDRTLVYLTDPALRDEIMRARGPRYFDPGIFLQLWHAMPDDESVAN